MQHFKKISALILTLLIALPASSFAVGSGGFENASFSAKQIGQGTSVTAVADEPATISYNPAGINDLPGIQYQGNANFINMWTSIESKNATGGSTQSSATTAIIPTTYLTMNPGKAWGFNDRVAFGLGVDSPFGLANKYDSNHTATHYTGYKNWLKMYTIKPVVSFRLAEWLSIGGGPIWNRVFNFGQVLAYPNTAIITGAPDGQVRANLKGNSWGWQMGILAKPAPKHKIGFYFRSPALIRLKGLAKGENIANDFVGGTSGRFETGVHTKLHLPMNMTWGYEYTINKKTSVSTDFGFTRWSVFDNLNVPVDPIAGTNLGGLSGFHNTLLNSLFNTPGPGGATDKDYHNSFTFGWGVSHKATDKLTLRGGNYYYTTPVSGHHLTPAVPDSNRTGVTVGLGYNLTDNLVLDAAYDAIFFFNRGVDNEIGNALPASSVDGTYKSFIHVWNFSLTYKWDGLKSTPKVEDWEGSTVAK